MNRGGLEPMWLAGVGVTLPVHRKRLASGLAEAEAQARASARLADSRAGSSFASGSRSGWRSSPPREKLVALYGKGIVPQDLLSVDAAVANYQTGKVPFIAVLEALTTLYNDRATHLGLLADHARIRASLEEASLEATSSLPCDLGCMRAGVGAAARRWPWGGCDEALGRRSRADRPRSSSGAALVLARPSQRAGDRRGRPARPSAPATTARCTRATCRTSPGDCPICGMKLVAIGRESSAPESGSTVPGRASLSLSPEKRQLLGVRSEPVHSGPLTRGVRTVGRVAVDERRLHHIHTKYDGYVEHLYVDFTGKYVEAGRAAALDLQPGAGGDAAGVPARLQRAQSRWRASGIPSRGPGLARPARGGAPAPAALGHARRGHRGARARRQGRRARSTSTPRWPATWSRRWPSTACG